MADIVIDVSSYNGIVDWKKLKANGVKGGIAKIIRKDLNKDNQFDNNYNALHGLKMPWGVYNYSYATTVSKAKSDMNLVCDMLDRCDKTYFKYGVWFDIEDKVQAVLSKATIADIINAAQDTVESRGYIFGTYTGMSYYTEHIRGSGVKCRNWWIARYYLGYTAMQLYQEPNVNYKPQLPTNICAWQYSSSVEMPATGNGGRGDASILYTLPTKVGSTTPKQETATTNNSKTANDIIGIMKSWIGLSRAKGTHKPIIDTYNAHKPLARNYKVSYTDEYCATTVSAAFIKANAVDLIGGTECSVERFIEDVFKPNGIWIEDGTITPKVGYIVCYNWDDSKQPNDGWADHIGIVESVNGKRFTVIEGNMNGVVGERTVNVGCGNIRGFAAPKYGTEAKKEEVTSKKKSSSKKAKAHYNGTYPALPPRGYYQNGDGITTLKNYPTQIKRVQMLVNWAVNAKLAVDGQYGKATTAAVNKFKKKVGLKEDGCFNLSTLNAAKEFTK